MSFGILSVNAIANFVHTVGFIWVMQFGFKRLTEKHESAESITSICLKSNPLKQWNAIYFSGRGVLWLSLTLQPHHLPCLLQTVMDFPVMTAICLTSLALEPGKRQEAGHLVSPTALHGPSNHPVNFVLGSIAFERSFASPKEICLFFLVKY